ncbi:MAG: response regulator [Pseudobdellovibrionaceae bacterium]
MSKVNILLVDDRPEGLVTLEAVLDSPEYNLVKANSGSEALRHVLANDFAVILMDVQMPEMDGFETATIIKQREKSRNIPIIFLTAINKADQYVTRGYSLGAVDYMFKPFDSMILKAKVAVFVDLYKKNQLLQEQSEALRLIERRDRMRHMSEMENAGRRRYQSLADAIPQIVFRANLEGSIEYFNQFWYRYSGKNVETSIGDGWKAAIHPKDLPEVERKWKESILLNDRVECECRIREDQSGEFRWHLLRIVPEFDETTELVGWIGVITDMHAQKMTQEEMNLARRMADAANETKSRFLANMSHEIRTPLGAILGFSELVVDPLSSESEKSESISVIRRNGEQLSKIIDDILDLSKVEAGKLDIDLKPIDLAELLRGVQTLMTMPAREKGLEVEFSINGRIPAKICSDANRLQQVLINVIGNGIKFSSKGNLRVTVSFLPATEDLLSRLHISVQDSGPGLTAQQIQNLFQPFTQVDTSMTRKYGGTGLGLALSRRLSRALGGDIDVQPSLPGRGCNFEITIATGSLVGVEMIQSLDTPSSSLAAQAGAQSATLKGLKILLVEDSEDNQILLKRFITMEGACVDLANNGLQGVEQALSGDHDVVLMDIQMPELDGYDAISRLRGQGFKKPIIALTAHGMIEDRQRCLQVGSDDHVAKPVNRAHLINRIREVSKLYRERQAPAPTSDPAPVSGQV